MDFHPTPSTITLLLDKSLNRYFSNVKMGTPIFLLRLSCSTHYFRKFFYFNQHNRLFQYPSLIQIYLIFLGISFPNLLWFFSSELTTVPPLPTTVIIATIITHYSISCCFLISFFANLFPFILVAFDAPRDIVTEYRIVYGTRVLYD